MGKSTAMSEVILMHGLFPSPFRQAGRALPGSARRAILRGHDGEPRTGSPAEKPATADATAGPGWPQRSPTGRLYARLRRLALAGLPALAVAACSAPSGPGHSAPTGPSACSSSQLDFSLDGGDGRFDGMSHSGTMLVLRNTGKSACTIPPLPLPRLTDANRQPLDIEARDGQDQPQPPAAVLLASGASATSDLRWVSGDVYDNGHCESPAFVTLALGDQSVSATFTGHLCGAGGQPSTFTMTPFQLRAPDASRSPPPHSQG